ncbi:MAG: hypothetical protein ACFHWZ_15055 [Phycisphaerales bacterium]
MASPQAEQHAKRRRRNPAPDRQHQQQIGHAAHDTPLHAERCDQHGCPDEQAPREFTPPRRGIRLQTAIE